MPNSFTPSTSDRRGATAVEVAIVLPLILLFAFACSDFGRAYSVRQSVCNAARIGAAYAASKANTDYNRASWHQNVHDHVLEQMQSVGGLDSEQLSVQITSEEPSQNVSKTTVKVSYPFHTLVNWPAVPNECLIEHEEIFRRFR